MKVSKKSGNVSALLPNETKATTLNHRLVAVSLRAPRTKKQAGDGIRTRDIQLGKLTFYH